MEDAMEEGGIEFMEEEFEDDLGVDVDEEEMEVRAFMHTMHTAYNTVCNKQTHHYSSLPSWKRKFESDVDVDKEVRTTYTCSHIGYLMLMHGVLYIWLVGAQTCSVHPVQETRAKTYRARMGYH